MVDQGFKVSAPGKIILFGEHAVVYGKRAIAAAVNLRTSIECKLSNGSGAAAAEAAESIEFVLCSPLMHNGEFRFHIGISEVRQLCSRFTCTRESAHAVGPSVIDLKLIASINEVLDQAAANQIKVGDQPASPTTHEKTTGDYEMMKRALIAFLFLCSVLFDSTTLPVFSVRISTALPLASGLGSSASFSVTLCTALLHLSGLLLDKNDSTTSVQPRTKQHLGVSERELIRKWSFVIETMFHERPSGIDNTIVTYGGLGSFEKGEFRPLPQSINNSPLHRRAAVAFPFRVLLVDTRVQRSTRDLVTRVRLGAEKRPRFYEHVFSAIAEVVDEFIQAYSRYACRDSAIDSSAPTTGSPTDAATAAAATAASAELTFEWLNEQVRLSQALLEVLDVSHPRIDQVRATLLSELGVRAKLTGAGGGGVVLAFLPDYSVGVSASGDERDATNREDFEKRVDATMKRLQACGFDVLVTQVGAHGVEFE